MLLRLRGWAFAFRSSIDVDVPGARRHARTHARGSRRLPPNTTSVRNAQYLTYPPCCSRWHVSVTLFPTYVQYSFFFWYHREDEGQGGPPCVGRHNGSGRALRPVQLMRLLSCSPVPREQPATGPYLSLCYGHAHVVPTNFRRGHWRVGHFFLLRSVSLLGKGPGTS